MRRGQTEMFGLILVVVILVMGVVMYMLFVLDNVPTQSVADRIGQTPYMTALASTTVPACGSDVTDVARQCLLGTSFCGDPCLVLTDSLRSIADQTITREGRRFNLSLEGTDVQIVEDCESADPAVLLSQQAVLPIPGMSQRLVLSMCR